MKAGRVDRREFIKGAAGAAAISALPHQVFGLPADSGNSVRIEHTERTEMPQSSAHKIKFAVIGPTHAHMDSQVEATIRGGGELMSFFAKEPELASEFGKRFPAAKPARSEDEILEDQKIQLVLSAAIPDERAPLGIKVMQHGKDYMSDKPGITSLEQLAEVRKVQAQTRRIYSIMYSERFENRATVMAGKF